MDKFTKTTYNPIDEIMRYLEMYEEKYSHYHFYNWELAELDRIDGIIDDLIKPYLDNEEVLLSMIKNKWRIMDHINLKERSPEFIYKAWTLNPKAIIRGMNFIKNIESFVESHEFIPEVIKEIERKGKSLQEIDRQYQNLYSNNHENEFIRFMNIYNEKQLLKSQQQQKQGSFYSLDGQTFSTIDEALMRNQEIQKEAMSSMKL